MPRMTELMTGAWRALKRVPRVLWLIAAAAVLLPVALVEITGALGGLLAGHGPVLVGPVAALGVASRWLGATGVRRGAWPADVATQLGDYRQVRAVLVLAAVLTAGALAMCWTLWRSMRLERLREHYRARGARWAESRELASLQVKGPEPGRVILGIRERRLLAAENNASTLIIAPSQAGKTS